MEQASSQPTPAAEPVRRFLDPFWEMRDHANQWDMSGLMRAPTPSAPAPRRTDTDDASQARR